ncbi:MAG: CinA family protein [Spirochaetota bacterium]
MNLEDVAKELIRLLENHRSTISFAESCTGGLVSAAITSIPGASAVFKGGVVAYANEAKLHILGIKSSILLESGSVSMECAGAMAKGAALCFRTDFALSITGIAGPDGGSTEKPVGIVWFGLACRGKVSTVKEHFTGNRADIRLAAAQKGLELISSSVKASFELDNPTDGGVSLSQA